MHNSLNEREHEMKSEINCSELVIVPLPQTIISVRDKNDRNNALDVGYVTNVSHDPAMTMVGIESIRFSNHMVKENV